MSEQRLIDANRIIDFIDCGHLRNPLELCFSESEVVNMLEQAPTVPAEVVVHCENCNWFEREDRAFDSCDGWCKYFRYAVHDDAFCSYGERRGREGSK